MACLKTQQKVRGTENRDTQAEQGVTALHQIYKLWRATKNQSINGKDCANVNGEAEALPYALTEYFPVIHYQLITYIHRDHHYFHP